eukprot:351963-Chlamydomonas_euryale.AAC.3
MRPRGWPLACTKQQSGQWGAAAAFPHRDIEENGRTSHVVVVGVETLGGMTHERTATISWHLIPAGASDTQTWRLQGRSTSRKCLDKRHRAAAPAGLLGGRSATSRGARLAWVASTLRGHKSLGRACANTRGRARLLEASGAQAPSACRHRQLWLWAMATGLHGACRSLRWADSLRKRGEKTGNAHHFVSKLSWQGVACCTYCHVCGSAVRDVC